MGFVSFRRVIVNRLRYVLCCRRIPNIRLDNRFLEHHKMHGEQKSLGGVSSPWLSPSPVLHCTVWWGCLGSSPGPSNHGLTVVTELPMAQGGTSRDSRVPKLLCIDRYSCTVDQAPRCMCNDGRELWSAVLRITTPPQMASLADVEQQGSVLRDIQDGIGYPLSNLHGMGVQLPHQHAARRYFTCGRRAAWRHAGCTFAAFFD